MRANTKFPWKLTWISVSGGQLSDKLPWNAGYSSSILAGEFLPWIIWWGYSTFGRAQTIAPSNSIMGGLQFVNFKKPHSLGIFSLDVKGAHSLRELSLCNGF